MTRVGKRITVAASTVTDIRINATGFATLFVDGVDQGPAGQTLQSHSLSFPPEVLPADVAAAVQVVREFAEKAIGEA